jgi:hypothetical protein
MVTVADDLMGTVDGGVVDSCLMSVGTVFADPDVAITLPMQGSATVPASDEERDFHCMEQPGRWPRQTIIL